MSSQKPGDAKSQQIPIADSLVEVRRGAITESRHRGHVVVVEPDGKIVAYAGSPMDAATGADALVVVTEWQEFRSPDFSELRRTLRQPLLFDGRNLFDPKEVRAAGLEYFGIGRP